jgi:hypothetical protein
MPFPFFPGGAMLALAFLGFVLAIFGLALKALDRAATGATTSIAMSIVTGLRGWAEERHAEGPVSARPVATESPSYDIDDLPTRPNIPLQRVARR